MIQFKQLRPFFATSSSTWMLLLLSLYFSWICPAESADRPSGYDITLVGQRSTEAKGSFYQYRVETKKSHKTKAYLPIFSFQERIVCFQNQVKANWYQRCQWQNLLPTPSTFIQFQTHLPRSIAAC